MEQLENGNRRRSSERSDDWINDDNGVEANGCLPPISTSIEIIKAAEMEGTTADLNGTVAHKQRANGRNLSVSQVSKSDIQTNDTRYVIRCEETLFYTDCASSEMNVKYFFSLAYHS